MSVPQFESQRDSVLQPRVARHELPWVNQSNPPQPQRGCACRRAPIRRNPVGVGGFLDSISQGSAARNPGLMAIAPLGQAFSADAAGQCHQKAKAWWELSLNQLGDALKQSFKLPTNPLKNPRAADEWEPYLREKQTENARLTRALDDAEAELNDRVYRLFDLTAAEIKLLQKEVEH